MIPRESILEKSAVTVRGDDLASIKIKHKKGGMSELIFRSYSQGREAAQGFPADIIMIDEQPNDDFWKEALTRTRATRGHVICSFTPLKGATSLIEEMMILPGVEDTPIDKFGDKYKSDGKWAAIRASWHDAPHIPASDIEDAKRDYSYDYDARVYGMPVAGHGRIFPYHINDISYDPREVTINPSWNHLISIDIGHGHGRDPSAVIQCAFDEENDVIYVTNEAVGETNTTRELTRMIASVNHVLPVVWPSDANRSSMSSDSSVADQLRDQGVNLLGRPFINPRGADGKTNNFKAPGINHINERFSENKLRISTACTTLLGQIEQYAYTETGKIQDGKDDAIDSFRYNIMSIIQGFGEPLQINYWDEHEEDDFHYNSY